MLLEACSLKLLSFNLHWYNDSCISVQLHFMRLMASTDIAKYNLVKGIQTDVEVERKVALQACSQKPEARRVYMKPGSDSLNNIAFCWINTADGSHHTIITRFMEKTMDSPASKERGFLSVRCHRGASIALEMVIIEVMIHFVVKEMKEFDADRCLRDFVTTMAQVQPTEVVTVMQETMPQRQGREKSSQICLT